MTHLQELPDHHRFEHGSYAARRNYVGVGHENELVQPREEGRVLECLLDERIHFSCSKGKCTQIPKLCTPSLRAACAPSLAACMRPGSPPVMMSQFMSLWAAHLLDLFVNPVPRLGSRGPEHRHAIAL